jgi:hypothetical protein
MSINFIFPSAERIDRPHAFSESGRYITITPSFRSSVFAWIGSAGFSPASENATQTEGEVPGHLQKHSPSGFSSASENVLAPRPALTAADWERIVPIAHAFSANVVASLYNYVDPGFQP